MSKKQDDNIIKLIIIAVIGAVVMISSFSAEVITLLNVISFLFIGLCITAAGIYFYIKKTGKNKKTAEPDNGHARCAKKSIPVPFAKVPHTVHTPVPKNDETNQKNLLTETEAKFKQFLNNNLPKNIEIHSKTRLVDLLPFEINIREGSQQERLAKRQVLMMHIDFTLVRAETSEVLLAVELDDGTHFTKDAQRRDAVKNGWLEQGGIPILRVPAAKCYTDKVLQIILNYCNRK